VANEIFWEFQNYLDFTRPQIIRVLSTPGDVQKIITADNNTPASAKGGGGSRRPVNVLHDLMHEALTQWKRAVPANVQAKIASGVEFMQAIRTGYKGPDGPEGVARVFASLQKNYYCLPTDISRRARVDFRAVTVMGSFTAPVALPMIHDDNDQNRGDQEVKVPPHLYKPVDIRKEQIIMNTVRLVKLVLLQDEGLNLPIVDFDIRPTSDRDGLIQMVPDCISLEELRTNQTDILPWIIEKNETSTETASDLRERFLQSCAAYCVISYLLGIGDRNLHNLLLRPDGSLFHIDFGFVLGQDPKPLEKPQMRITPEMLAVLGGVESLAYKRFRELSSRIYNCIRRHVNVFVVMLRLLVEATPMIEENGKISEEQLMKEIRRRFAPGENFKEAEILLYNHIEQSTTQTFTYRVIDKCHTLATGSLGPVSGAPLAGLRGAYHTANFLLQTLWFVTGLNQ
jgi:phosphatidylinositol 3-kinase